MDEFDIFREERSHPFPSTMRTALKGVRLRLEPAGSFYFRATSVDTIHKRPLDPGAVKELLARSGLSAPKNQELSRALFAGLVDEDRDLADFAAQGLTRIENRYQTAIKEAREAFNSSGDGEAARRLAELLLDFADVQWFDQTLRAFYIEEALGVLREVYPEGERIESVRATELLVRSEVMRKNTAAARELLDGLGEQRDLSLLVLEAEIAFQERDVEKVADLMERLADQAVDGETRALITTWLPDSWEV